MPALPESRHDWPLQPQTANSPIGRVAAYAQENLLRSANTSRVDGSKPTSASSGCMSRRASPWVTLIGPNRGLSSMQIGWEATWSSGPSSSICPSTLRLRPPPDSRMDGPLIRFSALMSVCAISAGPYRTRFLFGGLETLSSSGEPTIGIAARLLPFQGLRFSLPLLCASAPL